MPVIDADTIRKLITINDELFVPDRITEAIGQTVVSSVDDISDGIDYLVKQYKQYVTHDGPTPVSYSSAATIDATIDAYITHYLPRNTLIPKLLFLTLAYHPAFQNIKNEVNILDLGSGTGSVVLGLLDLFKDQPFSDIKINITSCEISELAIDKQRDLIKYAGYQHGDIQLLCRNVTDTQVYDKDLSKLAPYDYIIGANLLAELSLPDIESLLAKLPSVMAPNAVLLFADPPRTYVDQLKIFVSKTLRDLGLFCYYPCPPEYECLKSKCQWVWLNFGFICPDIKINGELLETNKLLQTT